MGNRRDVRVRHFQPLKSAKRLLRPRPGHGLASRRLHAGRQQHVGTVAIEVEPRRDVLPRHARREGAEGLAALDLEVERLLHGRRAGVGQDGAVAEGAWAELHPALEPAHHLARDQRRDRGLHQLVVREHLVACAGRIQRTADLVRFEAGTEQGSPHGVSARFALQAPVLARTARNPRFPEHFVARRQRGAERAPGVARRGLDPHVVEPAIPQDLAVGYTVERDAAGQTQARDAGLLAQRAGQPQHRFLDHRLRRGGHVHVPLRQRLVRLARGATEQCIEPGVGHGEAGAVIEMVEIEAERAVRFQVDQVVENGLGVSRLAVGRQAHQLVLAGIHLEAGVVGKRRVEQPQGVGEVDLPRHLQRVAVADGHGSGGPFADPVHGENHRIAEGRRVERARRVRLVVLGEQQPRVPIQLRGQDAQLAAQQGFLEQLLLDPDRDRRRKGAEPARRERHRGLEQTFELQEGLVVEGDPIDLPEPDAARLQAPRHGMGGIVRVVLLARKALLLRSRDDPSVLDEGGGAVVIERRESEDAHCSETQKIV